MNGKIDLGKLTDRELSLITAQTVNQMDEKLDDVIVVVTAHGLAISANTAAIDNQKARCDAKEQCSVPSNPAGIDRRTILTTGGASAAGGGIIMFLLSELFKRIFGG